MNFKEWILDTQGEPYYKVIKSGDDKMEVAEYIWDAAQEQYRKEAVARIKRDFEIQQDNIECLCGVPPVPHSVYTHDSYQ